MTGRHWRAKTRDGTRGRKAMAAAFGLCLGLLIGGPIGLAFGAVAGVGLWQWLRRQPSPVARAEQRRIATDLPYAADLLAAVLQAGAPPDAAAEAVGAAIEGPLGERLIRVSRAIRLGAPPLEAWSHLDSGTGAARLVRSAVRSHASGAALAGALTRLAEELRMARLTEAEAAARRAGVLIVLPLGLCFLPAFILAGLVPVIVAVLGDVLPG